MWHSSEPTYSVLNDYHAYAIASCLGALADVQLRDHDNEFAFGVDVFDSLTPGQRM